MQRKIQIITALTLIAAPAFSQESAQSVGADTTADQPQTLAELISAAEFAYTAVETSESGAARANTISANLLSFSGIEMAPAPVTLDGQALFHSEQDASAMLHIDTRNSTVVFSKGMKSLDGLNNTPGLPTAETAPAVARQVLDQLFLTPAEADEIVIEHVGGVGMGVEKPDGTTETFEKLRTVRFGRVLSGVKVEGPGSRIVVMLGENGEFHGLVHHWQTVAPIAIDPAEKYSLEELRSLVDSRIAHAAWQASEIAFVSAELVLYDDGQGAIEPVIRVVVDQTIESEFTNAEGELEQRTITNPLDFYVPIRRRMTAQLPFVQDTLARPAATPVTDN